MMLDSITQTFKELQDFSNTVDQIAKTFTGKKGSKGIADLNRAMPQLL
jgi:hypothetical protein